MNRAERKLLFSFLSIIMFVQANFMPAGQKPKFEVNIRLIKCLFCPRVLFRIYIYVSLLSYKAFSYVIRLLMITAAGAYIVGLGNRIGKKQKNYSSATEELLPHRMHYAYTSSPVCVLTQLTGQNESSSNLLYFRLRTKQELWT